MEKERYAIGKRRTWQMKKKIIMLYHVTDSNDQCNHIHKQCESSNQMEHK